MEEAYTGECPNCKAQARIIPNERWQLTYMDKPCPDCNGPTLRQFVPVDAAHDKTQIIAMYALAKGVSAQDVADYVKDKAGQQIHLTTHLIDEIVQKKKH